MKRRIVGFHRDDEGDWVAELDCFHGYHVRHDPPLVSRPWVLTAEGRAEKLGAELDCLRCDQLEWPEGLVLDHKSRKFSKDNVPAGLLKAHATPSGIWAKIRVVEGKLLFRVQVGGGAEYLLEPDTPGVIVPEMPHSLAVVGRAMFFLEFYRRPR